MTTVLVGGVPPVLEQWLQERARLGLDRRDEVWEGVLHVAPCAGSGHGELEAQVEHRLYDAAVAAGPVPGGRFNLGEPSDYRVPDIGHHRERQRGVVRVPSAALVIEIRSPGDETDAKVPFYAARGVQEVLVVDPAERSARWWIRSEDGSVAEASASALLGIDAGTLVSQLDWP